MSEQEVIEQDVIDQEEDEVQYEAIPKAETGKEDVDFLEIKDAQRKEDLRVKFAFTGEKVWRNGKGKRFITGADMERTAKGGKRVDFFVPRYDRCPAPAVDENGKVIRDRRGEPERCKFTIPQMPKGRIADKKPVRPPNVTTEEYTEKLNKWQKRHDQIKRYEKWFDWYKKVRMIADRDEKNATFESIYKNKPFAQAVAMRHMMEEHFDWWYEEHGVIHEDKNGNRHKRPPQHTDICNFPEWRMK
jgi:hypothetical protein